MSGWRLIGKGGANVVLGHAEHQNVLLRVPQEGHEKEPHLLDQFIWGASCSRQPLPRDTPSLHGLGMLIAHWGPIEISEKVAAAIAQTCTIPRGVSGMMLVNLLHLPGAAACISVELKPKCGFLPKAETIHPNNRVKWSTSRYRLHQHLKLHQGKVNRISGYDPLDLFSDDGPRQMQALQSLVSDPQNNLRVWDSGSSVEQSNLLAWVAIAQPELPHILQAILNHTGVLKSVLAVQSLDKWDVEGIQPLCAHAHFHILKADVDLYDPTKKMCGDQHECPWIVQWGLQGMQWLHEQGDQEEGAEARKHWASLRQLHEMTWNEVRDVLHSHCLAVAAKDCSIVISYVIIDSPGESESFQAPVMECHACHCDAGRFWNNLEPTRCKAASVQRAGECEHDCVGSVCLDGQVIRYRLGVVDMDRKSIGKVDKHLALDQQILHCWNQRQ